MRYWLGLGANLGDPRASIEAALARLGELARVEAVSHPWQTAPREVEDQPVFLNAGARVASDLDPRALLAAAKDLERALGRDPGGVRFGPRAIDCDLLLWEGGEWEDDVLTIPHPRLAERRFVLEPLREIAPGLRHPVSKLTVAEMFAALRDPHRVAKAPEGWP